MTFTVTPNTGYVLDSVTVDGTAVEVTDNTFVVPVRAAAEVVITYKKSYRITAIVSDQGGGRITVDEPHVLENMFVYVPEGDRITFTFTPDMGYEIDYVRVDGTQVTLTSDNKYTITDVKKTHTVSVVFKHFRYRQHNILDLCKRRRQRQHFAVRRVIGCRGDESGFHHYPECRI